MHNFIRYSRHLTFAMLLVATTLFVGDVDAFEKSKLVYSPRFESPLSKSINLGVVVLNDRYQIYRSKKLGRAGLSSLEQYLRLNNLPFPKTIIYMNDEGYEPFYEFAIEEYNLQDSYDYKFYHSYDYSYRTYLDGNNPYRPQDNIDDRFFTYLIDRYFGLAQSPQYEQIEGGMDAFFRIMKVLLDPAKQPVLFHCWGGRHRTGMIGMAIRYLQGGEWITPIGQELLPAQGSATIVNAAQKEYVMHNKDRVRGENFIFIDRLANDPRFIALKERYQSPLN
ncbi:MAG: hypothetical protein HN353_13145 [Bdellovibrionales bacterium]|jgi:hypothetical protein|nr:hypothetical protein [Bdellovibrionales bacterium]MBT3524963.1 hypothetical protein [Bdellovibrionales bacterium]MBT7670347.1 hypothetical protein [Bdellovibrionales bacterium]MBT7766389.1 hypothetical protein [Bdellovibrionales bacterium]